MTEQQDPRALAAEMIDRLRIEGTAPGLEVGTTAPNLSLPDANGRQRMVTELLSALEGLASA